MSVEAREIVPGEVDVFVDGDLYRVLVPAGVGLPGVADDDLAVALVLELRAGPETPAAVVDLSSALATDPSLLDALQARLVDAGVLEEDA